MFEFEYGNRDYFDSFIKIEESEIQQLNSSIDDENEED